MFLFLHYSFALCCKKSTQVPLKSIGLSFRWRQLAMMIFFIIALRQNATAQLFDSFDEARQKFRLWQNDAKAQLSPSRKEPGVEVIETSFGTGTHVYLLYPIEPCAIISDLNASIRILSAQSGLRIGFRVVFPRSTHPATHDPVTEASTSVTASKRTQPGCAASASPHVSTCHWPR